MAQHNILIVEDEKMLREIYGQLLELEGHTVHSAEDYDHALALIDSSIDLALLDIQLSGRSGLDILTHIRTHFPDCPVIMMSGYADKATALQALRQGAVEYLEKPVAVSDLVKAIRHWLNFRTVQKEHHRLQDFEAMYKRLKQREVELRLTNERLSFLLKSTAAVIYASTVSNQGSTTFISDNIEHLCGHDSSAFTTSPTFRLDCVHPEDIGYVRDELQRTLQLGSNRFEYRFKHKNGHYFWVVEAVRVEKSDDEEVELLGFIVDITERKDKEEEMRQLAYSDQLTGLPNRSLFYDRLKQAVSHCQRSEKTMAVLFMDLDFFKPINDQLGHEWGDRALKEVSKRLQSCVRETDTTARVGGDEFSIILVDISCEQEACHIANVIIKRIQQPLILNNSSHVLGISIGICMESDKARDADTFLRLADNAMYQAKQSGRNRYCVYRSPNDGG
ncbi:cyclic di-GMP phosphodiesterase Gmr [Mariprofundus micogutta]|uniref:Cyclic di-GMP phosphodiesterase Gmr n=1 Tax=Mariprofundus micogutta TaxID=1921010 RepID=A0A1L8CMP3_9PROT|nr:diguanylate cyclase [Mariprofundus micogutta]GAV20188.1 cyclic di-GMP phosphodiesterase Gmr [Mariprofundus micogutta]